jgi:hypothetical protein
MADLDDEKGSQNVGPNKPPRDGTSDPSDEHRPQHEAKSPDDDIKQPTPDE